MRLTKFLSSTLFSLLAALSATSIPATAHPTTTVSDAADSAPIPFIIWHGLGDNYANDWLLELGDLIQALHPGSFVYNIRLDEDPSSDRTATFLGNLTTQLASVCADLATHPILSAAPAVNALGFSQGGQFLRGYVERCNAPPVRRLVTFGAQHNGIAEFERCGDGDWICKGAMGLLHWNTWSGFVQGRVVPAQYYRETNNETGLGSDAYLENSNWLADVNNERAEKNETYKANLASLEKFVMYVFENDTTVIPKESGWFAEVNTDTGNVTALRDRKMYKEDWLGLRELDEKDGLAFRTVPGGHMHLNDTILKKSLLEDFGVKRSSSYESAEPERDSDIQNVLGDWEL
ncbi:Alpha/Beta hydrolase protein [Lineolata rhizophorae]|uniref:Palmitoyl-protein thioesterase 1 n=1 Tax=Lineolata rhizophorae TaxID=578093 RepID=A0A6A6NXZ1_9PEZI|nr:Alpha/Beta hydrolase protein [Lineolata rhizophorae]